MKGKKPDLKKWGFIAGGTSLLAVLVLVMCLLGGVFDFTPKGKAGQTTPELSMPTLAASPTPMQTMDPLDTPRPTESVNEVWWNISVIGGVGGTVTPSGLVQAVEGESVTLTLSPDEGYQISEMKVDGEAVEPAGSYTFADTDGNHSFYVVFRTTPQETETPEPGAASPYPSFPYLPISPTDIG